MTHRLGVALVLLLAFGVFALALAQTTGPDNVEIQRFVLPGTNTTGWRVHASGSQANLRLPAGDLNASGGYRVAYTFAHGSGVARGTTSVDVPIAGSPNRGEGTIDGVLHQMFPTAGSVIGLSIGSSVALTAGYAHAQVTVWNRVDATQSAVATTADATQTSPSTTGLVAMIGSPISLSRTRYATMSRSKDLAPAVPAGDGVGCQITATGDLRPNTAQLTCTVIVEY